MPPGFVLFAQGRSGSTLLGELLGCHPSVYFAGELLAAPVGSPRRRVDMVRWRHPRHVVGFHVKIYQLTDVQQVADPGAWLRAVHSRGWRVIALRRENLLRQVLSNMTALARERYHDRGATDDRQPLHVDPEDLLHWMRVRADAARQEEQALAGLPHVALGYESDLLDPAAWPATAARAFRHLGLEPVPVTSTLRRSNPGRLDELVENWPEVAASVAETEFARFLE